MNREKARVKRAVLITGCSSGIGKATATCLAEYGYLVLATVRKESDADKLRNTGIPDLVPLWPLDLVNLQQIKETKGKVMDELKSRGIKGLFALINNAGGGSPAPVELIKLDELEKELKVRVLGAAAMVQEFLPLLREGNGRIIWIMTPALIPTPYVASIHCCDFSVNCLARTLEIELKPWKIPNIMIKCGGIKTPAGLRTVQDVNRLLAELSEEKRQLYQRALIKWAEDMAKFDKKRTDAGKVAEVILKALRAERPKRRYHVGYMSGVAGVLELFPQSLVDRILRSRF